MTTKRFFLHNGKYIDFLDELEKRGERDYELLVVEQKPYLIHKEDFPLTKHFYSYKIEYKEYDEKTIEQNATSNEVMVLNYKTKKLEQIKSVTINGETKKRNPKINTFKSFGLMDNQKVTIITASDEILVGRVQTYKNEPMETPYLFNVKLNEEKGLIDVQLYYKEYFYFRTKVKIKLYIKKIIFNLQTGQTYEYSKIPVINDSQKWTKKEKEVIKNVRTKKPISNISRGNLYMEFAGNIGQVVSYIEDIILEYNRKENNIPLTKKISYDKESYEINTLNLQYCNNGRLSETRNFAFPYLCKLNYNPYCPELVNFKGFFGNRFREYFHRNNPNQWNEFVKLMNLPNSKKFKQYIIGNGHLFYMYLLIRTAGVTDINAILKWFDCITSLKMQENIDIFFWSNLHFIFRGTHKHGQVDIDDLFTKNTSSKDKSINLKEFLRSEYSFILLLRDILRIKQKALQKNVPIKNINYEKEWTKIQNSVTTTIINMVKAYTLDAYRNNEIRDGLRMYTDCSKFIDDAMKLKLYNMKIGTWGHDYLAKLQRELTRQYISFKPSYYSFYNTFEKTYNDYEFYLPMDNSELFEIGEKLNNCVGGYSLAVMNNLCIIIGLKKNDKIVACIEIRSDKKNIRPKKLDNVFHISQFKLHSNAPCFLSNEISKIANRWIKDCFKENFNAELSKSDLVCKNKTNVTTHKLYELKQLEQILNELSYKTSLSYQLVSKLETLQMIYDNPDYNCYNIFQTNIIYNQNNIYALIYDECDNYLGYCRLYIERTKEYYQFVQPKVKINSKTSLTKAQENGLKDLKNTFPLQFPKLKLQQEKKTMEI